MELAKFLGVNMLTKEAAEGVRMTEHGVVHRHRERGEVEVGARERKRVEDSECSAGMRNPADLAAYWPQLWRAMKPIRDVLEEARSDNVDLQNLTEACGESPNREPPSEDSVAHVRSRLEARMGVAEGTFEAHHRFSPLRFGLFRWMQSQAGDPDTQVAEWLEKGAPMGLDQPVVPGHLFPRVEASRDRTLEELEASERWSRNHPSFEKAHGEDVPPGVTKVREMVNSGFGKLYQSISEATAELGAVPHPAPMGNVTKPVGNELKHRVIMDLRRNGVNESVVIEERVVLPRGIDHARDMAILYDQARNDEILEVLVLDFKDAFMSIPLHPAERKYNCSYLPEGIVLKRDKLDDTEAEQGTFVVWNVLGFGGRPNPLIFARVASVAMRSGQALFSTSYRSQGARLRGQLFVDDPAVAVVGTPSENTKALDLLILWWMCLGFPLAWKKGKRAKAEEVHGWIGIEFKVSDDDLVTMAVPEQYLADSLQLLEPFCSTGGSVELSAAVKMVGKIGRIAQVIPHARPFVSGLWAALLGAHRDWVAKHPGQPFERVPTTRFAVAARWMRALITEGENALLPLVRKVSATGPSKASLSRWSIATDASTTGGGAILMWDLVAFEFFYVVWEPIAHLRVETGSSKFQTFWEILTMLLALEQWGDNFLHEEVAVLGDNTGALQNVLDLKGRGPMLAVAREIAWRKARRGWEYRLGHLPSERNNVSDALSRLHENPDAYPHVALKDARRVSAPDVMKLWKARVE